MISDFFITWGSRNLRPGFWGGFRWDIGTNLSLEGWAGPGTDSQSSCGCPWIPGSAQAPGQCMEQPGMLEHVGVGI